MRRNSRSTSALAQALSSCGVDIAARKLERWSSEGLGPFENEQFEAQVEHYRRLAELSTSGRDADKVALRLAAHGSSCRRLRPALLRRMGIDQVPRPPVVINASPDYSTDEESDSAFEAIETVAAQIRCQEQPRLFQKMLEALRKNAARNAETLHETPEELVHSVLVSIGWLSAGGDAYNVAAWAAVCNIDPAQIAPDEQGPDIEDMLEAMRPNPMDRDNAYRVMPLERLVAISHSLAQVVPILLLRFSITDVPEGDIEEFCTMLAPWVEYQMRLLAPRLGDFGLDTTLLPEPLQEIAHASRADSSGALLAQVG
jgi:hypothetical protein